MHMQRASGGYNNSLKKASSRAGNNAAIVLYASAEREREALSSGRRAAN